MTLNEIKQKLQGLETIGFKLPTGEMVASHFHVTEVGQITKHFIDCGGTIRKENVTNFQLWQADDYDHRLHPEKLVHIIELSEKVLELDSDLDIEVEYQGKTIEKYALGFDGKHFELLSKSTDCLAKDKCGIPEEKPRVKLADIPVQNSCAPGSGCC